MSSNRSQTNNEIKQYVEQKQVDQLKALIDKDSSILNQPGPDPSSDFADGVKYKQSFTVAEYIFLGTINVEILNYLLTKISDEALKAFLEKEIQYARKGEDRSTTALHLSAANDRKEFASALLNKLTQLPFDIDSLLTRKSNTGTLPLMAAYADNDDVVWTLYLDAIKDKKTILSLKGVSHFSILNYILRHRKNKDDVATLFKVLDNQTAAELIQNVLKDKRTGWTGLHQAVAEFDNTPRLDSDTIALLIQKLASKERLNLIFKQKNKENDTPYTLAKRNKRDDVIPLFLSQINFEEEGQVNAYLQEIKADLIAYPEVYSNLSLQGMLNLIKLTNVDVSLLVDPLIQRLTSSPHPALTLIDMARICPNRLSELIKHSKFETSIRSLPDYALFMTIIKKTNIKIPYVNDEKNEEVNFRRMMLEVVLEAEKNQWKLDGAIEKELSQLSNKIKLDRKGQIFQSILQLFGSDPKRVPSFNRLDDLNKTKANVDKYPEIPYLLALCYQHGLGVNCNDEKAIDYYKNAYDLICQQISNSKNPALIDYLHCFKQNIMQALANYFNSSVADDIKYRIADKYTEILLLEKNPEKSQQFLETLNASNYEQYSPFIAKLFYLLSDNNVQYLDTAIELKYGPALIKKAEEIINQTPANFNTAAHFYYQAMTTNNSPQVLEGIKGACVCFGKIEKKSTPEKTMLDLADFIVAQCVYKKNVLYWEQYKKFLEYMDNVYHYVPAKWILLKEERDSEDVDKKFIGFYTNLVRIVLEAPSLDEYNYFKQSDINLKSPEIIEHAKAVISYVIEATSDEKIKAQLYIVLALRENTEPQNNNNVKNAMTLNLAIAKAFLKRIPGSKAPLPIKDRCSVILQYIKTQKENNTTNNDNAVAPLSQPQAENKDNNQSDVGKVKTANTERQGGGYSYLYPQISSSGEEIINTATEQENLDGWKSSFVNFSRRLAAQEKKIDEQGQKIGQLTQELDDTKKELQEMKKENTTVKEENASLQKQLETKQQQVDQLTQEKEEKEEKENRIVPQENIERITAGLRRRMTLMHHISTMNILNKEVKNETDDDKKITMGK